MYGGVKNCDLSGLHGSMNSHTLYEQNSLKPLIDSNNSDDIEMNDNLNNGDMSHETGSINSHTLYQFN